MEQMKYCDGIVLFANQCSAVIWKGTWDEDGFYPEGITDVSFHPHMIGNKRLFPGDIIDVDIIVKKSDGKESIKWIKDLTKSYGDYHDDGETEKEALEWLKRGLDFKKKFLDDLKRKCFGTFEYTQEFREFGKQKDYPCCRLGACFCQEECFKKHLELKKQQKKKQL